MADGEPEVQDKLTAIGELHRRPGDSHPQPHAPWQTRRRRSIAGCTRSSFSATAIQCWTALEEFYGVVPCTLMSMMSESLLPSACETDIAGLLGMYVCTGLAATGGPARLEQKLRRRSQQGRRVPLLEPAKEFLRRARGWTIRRSSPGRSAGKHVRHDRRARAAGPFTYCRVSTDDLIGTISSYVGEGMFTSDSLETFGGYGVIEVPEFQRLLRMICERGFEHHVAATRATVAEAVYDGLDTYLRWTMYRHG